jgi:hypothetical protein
MGKARTDADRFESVRNLVLGLPDSQRAPMRRPLSILLFALFVADPAGAAQWTRIAYATDPWLLEPGVESLHLEARALTDDGRVLFGAYPTALPPATFLGPILAWSSLWSWSQDAGARRIGTEALDHEPPLPVVDLVVAPGRDGGLLFTAFETRELSGFLDQAFGVYECNALGACALRASSGDALGGIPGGIRWISWNTFHSRDWYAFVAGVQGAGKSEAVLFAAVAGAPPSPILFTGMPLPNAGAVSADASTLDSFFDVEACEGSFVFSTFETNGLFRWTPQRGLEAIFRVGQAAPGGTDGAVVAVNSFGYLEDHVSNGAGDVAFAVRVEVGPGGVTDETAQLLVVCPHDGPCERLLRDGDPVPGGPPGAVFSNGQYYGFEQLAANERGEIAFTARVEVAPGDERWGLFAPDAQGKPVLRLLGNEPIPGEEGSQFYDFRALALDDDGVALVQASSAFAWDDYFLVGPDGSVRRIAPREPLLELAPGVFAEAVLDLDAWDSSLDHFVFHAAADFTGLRGGGPSALFLVPEPSAIACGVAAIAALGIRRRRLDASHPRRHPAPDFETF